MDDSFDISDLDGLDLRTVQPSNLRRLTAAG